MSRAGILHGAINELFREAASGDAGNRVLFALLRELLAIGVLDRDNILSIARRLEARRGELSQPGPDCDAFAADDFKGARDLLVGSLNRDPGLDIKVTETDFTVFPPSPTTIE